jgi:hypothetical protein
MRVILIGILVLIAYGSLFPLNFTPRDANASDISALFSWPSRLSLGDVVGNLALFAPLGFLLGVMRSPNWLIFGFLFSVLYAAGLQYMQFWFPPRVPSGSDFVFNVVGCAASIVAGIFTTNRLESADYSPRKAARAWAALALVALWVASRWFPLVPTLDVQNVKEALKPLMRDRRVNITEVMHLAVAWWLWFRLCRYVFRDTIPYLACLAISVSIMFAEPFFYRNTITLNEVIAWLLGACGGILFWRGERALTALLALSGVVIAWWLVWPIDFARPAASFSWLPRSSSISGSILPGIALLVEKAFLIGAWLYLALHRGWSPSAVAFVAVAVGAVCGFFQRWSTVHVADPTNVVLVLLFTGLLQPIMSKNFTLGTTIKRISR